MHIGKAISMQYISKTQQHRNIETLFIFNTNFKSYYQQFFLLHLSYIVHSFLTHKYITFKVTSDSLHWFWNISSSPKRVQLVFLSHMAFAFCMTWSRSTEHLIPSMLNIWRKLPVKWVLFVFASKIWMDSSFLHTMVTEDPSFIIAVVCSERWNRQ